MRPPICAVCGRDLRHSDEGELVQFADHAPLADGVCGHPQGLEWFCLRHIGRARRLAHLPASTAIASISRFRVVNAIRNLFQSMPRDK